ncbi:MAG: tetratricopeptide repeat protein [Gemmatimonadota bacterium]|nr:MAG: tetratricopeptide repeat protein [Gemmatimonadota bacterium]
MTDSGRTQIPDPLRAARQAVSDGRFREAFELLTHLSAEQTITPEWHLLMAMASWRLGNFVESHDAATSALELFRARGDVDGEMKAQNVAAAGAFAMGRLEEAGRGFEWALALAQHLSDKLMMARCANNLGNVAYYRGDDEEALQHYSHAASLFEQVGSLHGIAEAWHNTGVVLRERGEYEGAAEAADRAADAASHLDDRRAVGWTLGGSGETDALQGDLRLGRVRVERALELAREQEDHPTETDCLRVLSRIAVAEGRLDQGLELAQTAVGSADRIRNPWMSARTRQQLASALLAKRRRTEAAEAYDTAAEVFEQLGSRRRARAMRVLADRLR